MANEHVEAVFSDTDYEAAFNASVDGTAAPTEPVAPAPEPEPVVEPVPTAAAVAEPETPPDIANITAKLDKMEAILAEAAKREAEPAPVHKAQPDPQAAKDDEEREQLYRTVEEDWPTIYKAQQLRIKELEEKFTKLLTESESRIKGELAPVTKTVQDVAQDRFLNTIYAVHADAADLLPEVDKWIATQPQFLQAAYNATLENGNAQDVIDLYTTFKGATGRNKPPEPPPAVDKTKEDRLAQMEAVKAERTSSIPVSEDDFEGAFNRAAQS